MNIKEIKELIKMLDGTDITQLDLEMESDGVKISIKKGGMITQAAATSVATPPTAVRATEKTTETAVQKAQEINLVRASEEANENQVKIVAPMVGTFYRAPAPDAEPYVKEGDRVIAGQPLCIIEAMKLMNEIESEVNGTIIRVLAENGQPVEYGQPLFLVEKA
ncbi:MAG: acetyl-CoA carboxylase biotin carboxyl carrier protein, partial [Syntrophothermus sp.]